MSLGKKDIVHNITTKALISKTSSKLLLDSFIKNVIYNSSRHTIKISKFGSFYIHTSPKRIGRNPKTKEKFVITKREKLKFNPSNYVKSFLN